MAVTLPDALQAKIRARPDLWREVCIVSLELLEGTNEHVDRVLALYRRGNVTQQEWYDAIAAAYAAKAISKVSPEKVERFLVDLFLLLECSPVELADSSQVVLPSR